MAEIHAKLLEEKLLRAQHARRRFKAIVRHVIYNLYWLRDATMEEETNKTLNVKQTVNQLVRQRKVSTSKSLKPKDILLLRKHKDDRTEEDKRHLFNCIGGLKCFRRYPEEVQQQLVAVTYFEYYGPGRVIVRQNQRAEAMYFLLSGETIISRLVFDEVKNIWVSVEVGRSHSGSIFGEVSLLHNVPRTATVTTASPCEMIVLNKEDFDNILKSTLTQQWDEIRDSMKKLMYFDQWDNVTIRECCILSTIKTFEPNQVILGDGVGQHKQIMAYFIIDGTVKIIEHLLIQENVLRGIKYYKLYEKKLSESKQSLLSKDQNSKNGESKHETTTPENEGSQKSETKKEDIYDDGSSDITQIAHFSEHIYDFNLIQKEEKQQKKSLESVHQITNANSSKKSLEQELESDDALKVAHNDLKHLPANVKLRFVEICTLGATATFSDDHLLKNRRAIASTHVKCLVIPTYWLLQHNKGNVWTRVDQYYSTRIPSTQEVFNAYVNNKKWQQYKKQIRNDVYLRKKFPSNTTIHDVPYSIRISSSYD